jgi:hypothetical protein
MAIKTFTDLTTLPASDINTYLANSGLVFVSQTNFTNQPNVQINNCFPSDYTRFRVIFSLTSVTTAARYGHWRLSAAGTPSVTGYFSKSVWWNMATGTSAAADFDTQTTRFCLGPSGGTNSQPMLASVDVYNPNVAAHTSTVMQGTGAYFGSGFFYYDGGGAHTVNSVYDGLFFAPTADNVTGSILVYGYRNS